MNVRIERLVGMATLQGPPIHGYRRYGVPPGGAADQESFVLANSLLGNGPRALVLEVTNAAIAIAFSACTRAAVVGAALNSAFDVGPDRPLLLEAPARGFSSAIAISGGWIPDGVDSELGRQGRILGPGDVLQCAELMPAGREVRLAQPPSSLGEGPIRVVRGPEPLTTIAGTGFVVSNDSDRKGVRLDGLPPTSFEEIVSEPACQGAIQLTPSGQMIVIGPDGPTIGGYPKVAVVVSADLDRLAQLRPGDSVEFEEVDLAAARALRAQREQRIREVQAQVAAYLRP